MEEIALYVQHDEFVQQVIKKRTYKDFTTKDLILIAGKKMKGD